jgi:hypothetical protein
LNVVEENAFRADWIQAVADYKRDEKDYQDYSIEDCHTVQLLNSFLHHGPNG